MRRDLERRARPLVALVLMAPALPACNDGTQAAAAAITLGAAVAAAAINRAATDECWGNCPPGTYCDEGSGLCIAPDESYVAPPSEDEVEWVECDRAAFECGTNQWLRCQKSCEWVMCGPGEGARSPDDPERCCHQPCEWVDCHEDGRPCETAQKTPARRAKSSALATAVDPCRGLCLPSERCVVRDAVADCVVATP